MKNILIFVKQLLIINSSLLILVSCSLQKQIYKSAEKFVLRDSSLATAHIGISIYEPATNKYWYNYQGDHYFVPASNTKIPTCYAAMKYLGDSLVGLRYGIPEERWFKENVVVIQPGGDPSFLLPEYIKQPAFEFLKQKFLFDKKKAGFYYDGSVIERWGNGWSWNDYDESYMAERNIFPVFGNVITIHLEEIQNRVTTDVTGIKRVAHLFKTESRYFDSLLNQRLGLISIKYASSPLPGVKITRSISENEFFIEPDGDSFSTQVIPFVTNTTATVKDILSDTLKAKFTYVFKAGSNNRYEWANDNGDLTLITINKWNIIHSQPTDSLLKPMMHRSDNFFAEQSLLMVSNKLLGVMNDEKIIDSLLKTDLKDLPQKPVWVDGSGLSRYNLFTPQDFVFIFNKMKNDFGMERIKNILPTGNEGTLSNYYLPESGYIFAKTGTLSGVVSLSGFLYTKKNKLLIFSVLINNHNASAPSVRRAVEKFIVGIRNKF